MKDIMELTFNDFLEDASGFEEWKSDNGKIINFPQSICKFDPLLTYDYLKKITDNFNPYIVQLTLKRINVYINALNERIQQLKEEHIDYSFFFEMRELDAFKFEQFIELISMLEAGLNNKHSVEHSKISNTPEIKEKIGTGLLKDLFPFGNIKEEDNKEVDVFNDEPIKYDATDSVNDRFKQLKAQFNYFKKTTRDIPMLIDKDLKFIENRRDNKDPFKWNSFRGCIDLHPLYAYGWDRALYNIFIVADNMYKGYPEMIDDIICYARDRNEDEQELFKELSNDCAETAISGMSNLLYYLWLKAGAKEETETEGSKVEAKAKTEGEEESTVTSTILSMNKNKDELTTLHNKLANFIKPDLNSWLFWFGGIQTNTPKQMEWLKSIPELLYFISKLCPDDFKPGKRKIKEINIIFKTINGNKVDSSHAQVKPRDKKNAIDKLLK